MTVAAVAPGMRIAFLSVSAEMGGSEVSLLELMRGLRRLVPAWRLDLVVPRDGPLAAAARDVRRRRRTCCRCRHGWRGWAKRSRGGAADLVGRGAALVMAAGSVGSYSRRLARLLDELAPDVDSHQRLQAARARRARRAAVGRGGLAHPRIRRPPSDQPRAPAALRVALRAHRRELAAAWPRT